MEMQQYKKAHDIVLQIEQLKKLDQSFKDFKGKIKEITFKAKAAYPYNPPVINDSKVINLLQKTIESTLDGKLKNLHKELDSL